MTKQSQPSTLSLPALTLMAVLGMSAPVPALAADSSASAQQIDDRSAVNPAATTGSSPVGITASSSAASPVTLLTVDALVDRVLASQTDLRAAALAVDAAVAAVVTARALPNPRLDWQTGRWRPMPTGAAGDSSAVTVSQPLENPWLRQARRAAAEAGVDVAREQSRLLRNDIAARTRVLAIELGLRQTEVIAFTESLGLLELVRDRVRKRVEIGEAARYDLIKSDAEMTVARQRVQQSLLQVDQVRLALNRLAGGTLPAGWTLAPGAVLETGELLNATASERGLGGNPELTFLQQVTRQAAAVLGQTRASVLPSVDVVVNRSREPDVRQSALGLSLNVPLLDRRQGPIAQAQAELSRTQVLLDGRRAELAQELEMARKALEMAQSRVRALSQGALAEAEAAVRVAEAAWRFGERGILDVLDAQRVLRTLRADLIQARFEAQSALIEIERLEGRHVASTPR